MQRTEMPPPAILNPYGKQIHRENSSYAGRLTQNNVGELNVNMIKAHSKREKKYGYTKSCRRKKRKKLKAKTNMSEKLYPEEHND